MEFIINLFESVRVWFAVVPLGLAAIFFFQIVQYLSKRDFEHVNVYIVHFTRYDHKRTSDQVQFRILSHRMPLQGVLRSSYVLLIKVLWASIRVTPEQPVLDLSDDVAHTVLASIRGEILEGNAEAEFARGAGVPFIQTSYRMALLNDLSVEDTRTKIMRVMLIQERDLLRIKRYLRKAPKNSHHFELYKKIQSRFEEKPGNFLDISITTTL